MSGVAVRYATRRGDVNALRGVDLAVGYGESFGLVGESGSGKSTLGWTILRLLPPNGRVIHGEILFDGTDVLVKSERQMRAMRGSDISLIIQGARGALNPLVTVGNQLANVYQAHRSASRAGAFQHVVAMLERVRLPNAARISRSYPHELSGGELQRVVIAAALLCDPKLLIADEPTTGLDATVQIDVLDLIQDLANASGTSMLLITHDLAVVAHYCHRMAVLFKGQIVEVCSVDDFFSGPIHPYSAALLSAFADESPVDRVVSEGSTPQQNNLEKETLRQVEPGHWVRL
jgi:ABC-type dipeptide/oligopeptide/nickel transport system ATPase component